MSEEDKIDHLKKVKQLKEYVETYKQMVMVCFHREDWHGVADAANDIRELKAEIEGLLKAVCTK